MGVSLHSERIDKSEGRGSAGVGMSRAGVGYILAWPGRVEDKSWQVWLGLLLRKHVLSFWICIAVIHVLGLWIAGRQLSIVVGPLSLWLMDKVEEGVMNVRDRRRRSQGRDVPQHKPCSVSSAHPAFLPISWFPFPAVSTSSSPWAMSRRNKPDEAIDIPSLWEHSYMPLSQTWVSEQYPPVYQPYFPF